MDIFHPQTVSYTHLDVYKRQTYGTASASFLATRCLAQIAYENKSDYPTASRAIANDFYVDDLITGSDDPNVLAEMKCKIVKLLSRYGFTLHKCCLLYTSRCV